MNIRGIICTITGIAGGALATLFGGWTAGITALITCMIADYITGLIVAGVFKNSCKTESGGLESRVGWKGLCRKVVIIALVAIGHQLDIVTGLDYIQNAVVIGFLANEIISIIENAGLMGIPMPAVLMNAIDILKKKSGESNGD